jgi:hypothetical protein
MTHTPQARPNAPAPTLNAGATGHDRRTLDAIFRHPLAHSLAWRDVVALLNGLGGAEEKASGEMLFRAGEEHLSMKPPHGKSLLAEDVMALRHFLTRAGWSPDAAPSPVHAQAAVPGLIVVIDHAGAKVYHIDLAADDAHGVTAYDPSHLLHHLERKHHDADRDETDPDDERFFAQVAAAVAKGGEIVVIGHGKGQSNEADHLTAYLQRHHKDVYARVVREITADLSHLTTPELLALGRRAFGEGVAH